MMFSAVKNFRVTCYPASGKDSFTSGDWVSGQVTLEVTKTCELDYMFINFKGKAEVQWSERIGYITENYSSKIKYFSLKHYFMGHCPGDDDKELVTTSPTKKYSNAIAPGRHVYPFKFQIPLHDTPSSFSASLGKIVYLLEARASRSTLFTSKDSMKIDFVSKPNVTDPQIMAPQHLVRGEKFHLFNSGSLSMCIDTAKTGFCQGEGLKVVVRILNESSREVRPTFHLYRKRSFFANEKRRLETKEVLKDVGPVIAPSASKKITKVIPIPDTLHPSILNCGIIKVEYRLRVDFNMKFTVDPKMKIPIIILPASQAPAVAPRAAAAAAAAAAGAGAGAGAAKSEL